MLKIQHFYLNVPRALGDTNIAAISLNGVSTAIEKHSKEGAEIKGVKAHFNMDDSGILNLLNVELFSEKLSTTVAEEEGTSSIFGSISKLFAGLCEGGAKNDADY